MHEETALWLAIYHQALKDALVRYTREPNEHVKAKAWFRDGGEDFQFVCTQAGLDPDYARQYGLRLMRMAAESPEAFQDFISGNNRLAA